MDNTPNKTYRGLKLRRKCVLLIHFPKLEIIIIQFSSSASSYAQEFRVSYDASCVSVRDQYRAFADWIIQASIAMCAETTQFIFIR